jgi:tRNA-specific 2-thiouridylase
MFRKVFCGISGGIDSAVACHMLQKCGKIEVVGVFMKNWDAREEDSDESKQYCSAGADFVDAVRVAKHLNVPLLHANFVSEYFINVFSYMLDTYRRGFTPNPDIMCNRFVKFDAFLKYAQALEADAIV